MIKCTQAFNETCSNMKVSLDMRCHHRYQRPIARVFVLLAGEVTHLLSYVSLNLTAVRKILKKMAKHIPPEAPTPGYLSLEIRHPHKPGYRLVQVKSASVLVYSSCNMPTGLLHETELQRLPSLLRTPGKEVWRTFSPALLKPSWSYSDQPSCSGAGNEDDLQHENLLVAPWVEPGLPLHRCLGISSS